MVVLDFSIVNVALPSIQRELGFSASLLQWIVTGYAITFGGLLILGGRAADLFGRRRMFTAGLLLFTGASLAGGLAHDPALLVASRVVQGMGAALVAPAALSLITTGFPQGPARNRALGRYGATASIGFVAGQVLGGVLVQFTSWRAVVPGERPGRRDRRPARAAAARPLARATGPAQARHGRRAAWSRPPSRRWCSRSRKAACWAGPPRPSSSRWLLPPLRPPGSGLVERRHSDPLVTRYVLRHTRRADGEHDKPAGRAVGTPER